MENFILQKAVDYLKFEYYTIRGPACNEFLIHGITHENREF